MTFAGPRADESRPTLAAARPAVPLELRGVSKRFGRVQALLPTTLTIEPGRLVALLGPSGCGKTTTLRIIAGFESPDAGHVIVGGRDITDLPPNRRGLGMVFQNYSLFPHMTVGENVAFGMKMARVQGPEVVNRVGRALDLVRLPGFEDRYPHQLSGGQQQRVALARSLVTNPSVLLLDEPLGALDKNLRESMQFELRQLQQQLGITTVLVTHDQEEALTMSDAIAVMHQGRILQYGPPNLVYERPATRFVSEFLGTSNVFPGRVAELADPSGSIMVEAEGGLRIRARAERALMPGTSVIAAVRPEKIRLSASPGRGDNVAEAVVIDHVFRGSYHVYQFRVGQRRDPVLVYEPSLNPAGHASFAPGMPVFLSWSEENVMVLDESEHAN